MDDLNVTLVSTGLDDGLSGPIHLPGVVTLSENVSYSILRLEEAIEFVMDMEERERKATSTVPLPPTIALIGHKPHRYLTHLTNLPYGLTKELRWIQGPILGPSSTWVDPDKYRYSEFLAELNWELITIYNESREANYRLWLLGERWKNHSRAWYF